MKKITLTIEHNLTPMHEEILQGMVKAFSDSTNSYWGHTSVKELTSTVINEEETEKQKAKVQKVSMEVKLRDIDYNKETPDDIVYGLHNIYFNAIADQQFIKELTDLVDKHTDGSFTERSQGDVIKESKDNKDHGTTSNPKEHKQGQHSPEERQTTTQPSGEEDSKS